MAEDDRHSHAVEMPLIDDPDERARVEVVNGLKQYDLVEQMVLDCIERGRRFRFRPSMLLDLQRCALEGLTHFAGTWRTGPVTIGKSKHQPPLAGLVPSLVEVMCDYVTDNFEEKTAIHLSAYVMWRLNWIHPFVDGNGRTSRAASYFVLCMKSGNVLPGKNTIPDQIAANKPPYYHALELADEAWADGERIDLTELENLLSGMLANQLVDFHKAATGAS